METENNEHELMNNEPLKSAIETIFTQGGRQARPLTNESIVIATQGSIDYEELVKTYGGESIRLEDGHSFNPFKDATDEQIEEFITAYCASYPDEFRDLVREKLVKEIEGIKEAADA